MDFYPSEYTSNHPNAQQSTYEVPSFEEAFDNRTLRDFYRKQSLSSVCPKELGMEEEFRSQAFDVHSPATTVQSHGFLDMFNPHYEDLKPDGTFMNTQNPNKTLHHYMSPLKFKQTQVSKGLHINFALEGPEKSMVVEKVANSKENKGEENIIALLCEQMKQYYDGDSSGSGSQPMNQDFFMGRQASAVKEVRKNMDQNEWEEEKLGSAIIRKIISKQKIFVVRRDTPLFEGISRKSSTMPMPEGISRKNSVMPEGISISRKSSVMPEEQVKEVKKRKKSMAQSEEGSKKKKEQKAKEEEGVEKIEKTEKKEKKPRKKSDENGEEKKEKKEKKERKPRKKSDETGEEGKKEKANKISSQLNIQIGGSINTNNEKVEKAAANGKKVILGNITTGMKDLGSYQMNQLNFSSS